MQQLVAVHHGAPCPDAPLVHHAAGELRGMLGTAQWLGHSVEVEEFTNDQVGTSQKHIGNYMVYGIWYYIYIYMDNKYYGIWYMVYNTMVETYYRI